MTERMDTDKTQQFTARVHRQHNSLVVIVPKGICNLLGITAGDILVFEHWDAKDKAVIGRLSSGGWYHVRDSGNSDIKDKGG